MFLFFVFLLCVTQIVCRWSLIHSKTYTGEKCGEMYSIQGLRRHKQFCTGLKLCPVCKCMIKILDFETHVELCKTTQSIQTNRILKKIKTKSRTSQVRVNRSHTGSSSTPSKNTSLETLRDHYKELFQKNVPIRFQSNEQWLRQKISSLPPDKKFVQGEDVYVLASTFGKDWAKQEFGSKWRSAKCKGKLGKYNKKRKMWEVRYTNDRNVYYFKEKDLIASAKK